VLEASSVPAFTRDGILGKAGETLRMQQIGEKSSVLVQEFVYNSVAPGTLKIYRYTWDLFRSYGKLSGVDVDKYSFDFLEAIASLVVTFSLSHSLTHSVTFLQSIQLYPSIPIQSLLSIQVMVKSWPSHGQVMEESWPSHGQVMAKYWPSHYSLLAFQLIAKLLPNHGKVMDYDMAKSWWGHGKGLASPIYSSYS
jgi:hypothetical protein